MINAKIERVTRSEIRADTSQFQDIKKIHIEPSVERSFLTTGKELLAVVQRIEDQIAFAKQTRGTYSRNHSPGDLIEVTAETLLSEGVCRTLPSTPRNLDWVAVPEIVPLETAKVELIKTRNGVGFARVMERVAPGIQIGDEVTAKVEQDRRIARRWMNDVSIEIHLDVKAPVDGVAVVKLTKVNNVGYTGELLRYTDKPISPGTTHTGRINKYSSTMDPDGCSFVIHIKGNVEATGRGKVVLTEVADKIYGKVVGDIDPIKKRDDNSVGSKNSLINRGNL